MADDQSSIPSVVDGLTPVQRTSLLCVFKKDFSDYLSENSPYRHGKQNLATTMTGGMAQNYNNINLVHPSAAGAAELSSITRYIFHYSDEPLLEYLICYEEDFVSDEPTWLMPVIPMVLVNGSEVIGANYNPRDVIANVRRQLKGEKLVPMEPWYKWFEGTIQKNTETSYTTSGIVEERNNKLFITELPIGRSAEEYEEFLKAAALSGEDREPFIQDYIAHHYDGSVAFEVIMSPNQMNEARQEGFHKKFELTTDLDTSNIMYLLDANSREKKYGSLEEIFQDFFAIRLDYYNERKLAMLHVVENVIGQLESQDTIYNDEFSEVTANIWYDKIDKVLYAELKNNHFLRSSAYCRYDVRFENGVHTEWYAKLEELEILRDDISVEELWLHDLDALEEQLNERYKKEAEGRKKWIPPVSDYESEKQEPSKVRSSSLEEDVSLEQGEDEAEMRKKRILEHDEEDEAETRKRR